MKKPEILLILKCVCIVYVLTITKLDNFAKAKSATPLITKGNCSINVLGHDEFSTYIFSFLNNGTVLAKKDGVTYKGQWMEDDIAKKINIHFTTYNPTLSKLNNRWIIKDVNQNELVIESLQTNGPSLVTIASL